MKPGRWLKLPGAKVWLIMPPFVWLLFFFAVPFLIILKISLAKAQIAQPPYTPLFDYVDDQISVLIDWGNYAFLFSDPLYINAYLSSLKIASVSTVLCLLIGYPIAYAIARMRGSAQSLCLMLIILPSWTSFLIRVYAWMGILKNNGIINNMLMASGLIDSPIRLLNTEFAVYVGIVYTYLPFLVLPLYANLVKLDIRLLEAAADLGAGPIKRFFTVTLPLSRAGVIAGSMLVFIPVVGEFVIPELLGGADILMIGKVLWGEFFGNRDWPVASSVAIIMLLLLMLPILVFHRYQYKDIEGPS